jgi:biotin operon repressor
MANKLSQLDKVLNYLLNHGETYPGVTASRIASDTKVPRDSVAKRIYDLREQGLTIYTNVRKVQGQPKSYYRLSA